MMIDNTPPTLRLLQPTDDEVFRLRQDGRAALITDARNDDALNKVEFYANRQLFKVRTVEPFVYRTLDATKGRRL